MQNTKYNKSLPLAERLAIIRAKAEYMKKHWKIGWHTIAPSRLF
jgi:hypothetical protein